MSEHPHRTDPQGEHWEQGAPYGEGYAPHGYGQPAYQAQPISPPDGQYASAPAAPGVPAEEWAPSWPGPGTDAPPHTTATGAPGKNPALVGLVIAAASLFALTLTTPIVSFVLYTVAGPYRANYLSFLPSITASFLGCAIMGVALVMARPQKKARTLALTLLGASFILGCLTAAAFAACIMVFTDRTDTGSGTEAILAFLVYVGFPALYGIANGLLISAYFASRGYRWWTFLLAVVACVFIRLFEGLIVGRVLGAAFGTRGGMVLVQCFGAIVFGAIYAAILVGVVLVCSSRAKRGARAAGAAGALSAGGQQGFDPRQAPGWQPPQQGYGPGPYPAEPQDQGYGQQPLPPGPPPQGGPHS